MFRFPAVCAALIGLLYAAGYAQAQPSGALGSYFLYRVQTGDTLSELAQTYLRTPRAWPSLQTLNQVNDPYQMPVGLTLRIPLSQIPREAAQARLVHVRGAVRINNASTRTDMLLTQGHSLSTGDNSYATFTLEDGSLITVPPNTDLHLTQLQKFQGTNLTDLIIDMPHGGLEATVAPSGSGVGRFEVRTPVAVTGVRGTRFRVNRNHDGQTGSVTTGSVRLQARPDGGNPGDPTLISAGYGTLVRANGTLAGSWPLLPAPTVAVPRRQDGQWFARITPVAGATAYEVIIAHDQAGHLRASSTVTQDTDIRLPAGINGAYLIVRAIDTRGLRGQDARLDLIGNALLDSRGDPVLDGSGHGMVLLTDY